MTETKATYTTSIMTATGTATTTTDEPIICGCGYTAYTRRTFVRLGDIIGMCAIMPGDDRPYTLARWMCGCGREWYVDIHAELGAARLAWRRRMYEKGPG